MFNILRLLDFASMLGCRCSVHFDLLCPIFDFGFQCLIFGPSCSMFDTRWIWGCRLALAMLDLHCLNSIVRSGSIRSVLDSGRCSMFSAHWILYVLRIFHTECFEFLRVGVRHLLLVGHLTFVGFSAVNEMSTVQVRMIVDVRCSLDYASDAASTKKVGQLSLPDEIVNSLLYNRKGYQLWFPSKHHHLLFQSSPALAQRFTSSRLKQKGHQLSAFA